jgi:hypothetical protein
VLLQGEAASSTEHSIERMRASTCMLLVAAVLAAACFVSTEAFVAGGISLRGIARAGADMCRLPQQQVWSLSLCARTEDSGFEAARIVRGIAAHPAF